MPVWLCRAGKFGEYEPKFLEDNKVYCTWNGIEWDMTKVNSWDDFKAKVKETYPDESNSAIGNFSGQLWAFSHRMKIDDLVVMPSKISPVIHVGCIMGDCVYSDVAEPIYRHSRVIKWLKQIPRTAFEQDLLYSMGAFMTFCQITRNEAENRIRGLLSGKKTLQAESSAIDDHAKDGLDIDIEEAALQDISDQIIRKFSGHGMARVVAAILEAKGFTTFVSPAGPDKGVDILASQGKLGFDNPRICVQVKSGTDAVDRPTLDQLIGAMSNHKAEYGMLVSWGGFRNSVISETANHFFKVRLWTHKDIVQEFLHHYDNLTDEIKAAVPLKRIWILDKYGD